MKKVFTLICAVGMFLAVAAQESIYDYAVKDQDGKEVKMSEFRGKYLLIVNTATQCGFTPQYDDLQHIYEKFADLGLVILDFPCNQFGEQAPGSNKEIHNFCTANYRITFPQFAKVDVNGINAEPLFTWLKAQKGFEGFDLNNPIGKHLHEAFLKQDKDYAKSSDIKWNFTKFLVDKDGNVVKRIEPTTNMETVLNEVYNMIFKDK